jgi:hypothetical protein
MARGMRFTEAELDRMRHGLNAKRGAIVPEPPPKPSKYRNVRTTTEDGTFASKREAERASHLKLLEKSGHITALQYQVRFKLMATGVLGVQHFETYVCDMVYFDIHHRKWVCEDVKGVRTPDYTRKKRLMRELYGLEVIET